MIRFTHRGSFNKTEGFLTQVQKASYRQILVKYGIQGVRMLADATPKDTGESAISWDYEITVTSKGYKLSWTNSNTVNDLPVVILIQYGHGLQNGSFVEGRDFINPALKGVLEELNYNLGKELGL